MALRVLSATYHEVWVEAAPTTGAVTIQTGIPVVGRDPAELSRMEAWLIITAGAGLASSPVMSIGPTGNLVVSFVVAGGTITYTLDIHYHQPQGVDAAYAGLGIVLGAGGGGGGVLLLDHLNAPVPPAPPGPTFREVFVGAMVAGVPDHTQVEVVSHPTMPHVDTANGNVVVGGNAYPLEHYTGGLFDKPLFSTDAVHLVSGDHDRAAYCRNTANPAGNTTMRTWGVQGSAEIEWANARNFNSGYLGDLTGLEGAFIHWGSGSVQSACCLITQGSNRGGGHIENAVGVLVLVPVNAYPNPGGACSIQNRYGLYVMYQTEGYAEPVNSYGLIVEDLCGPVGIGYTTPVGKLCVKGGIHAGGTSDPGFGKIQGAFVSSLGNPGVSGTFKSADVPAKTITVEDGIIVSIV